MNAKFLILFVVIAACLSGCNVGNAPAPMSDNEVKNAIDNMSPEQHIHFIEGSPLPKEEKEKQIAEIKAKAGIK